MILVVLVSSLAVFGAVLNAPIVKGDNGTIYIRADGSIDPPTAPITTLDNITYSITGDINSDSDGIVVERNNILVEGAGHTLQGLRIEPSKGVDISGTDNVTVKNMSLQTFYYGIYLSYTSYCTVSDNNITDTVYIIRQENSFYNNICRNDMLNNNNGIELHDSSNNTFSENRVANSGGTGIDLYGCSSNSFYGNNITGHTWGGMFFSGSFYNVLRNNSISSNGYMSFMLGFGENLSEYINDVDATNTVEGKPIYYWVNKSEKTIPSDAGAVIVVNCTGITAENLTLTNNGHGILLAYTRNTTVSGNNITNNEEGIILAHSSDNALSENNITANRGFGIWLEYSASNTVFENNITSNGDFYGSWHDYGGILLHSSSNNTMFGNNITANIWNGVRLIDSSDNKIYHNSFGYNSLQITIDTPGSVNSWDDGYPSGGNYWYGYSGYDADRDGIGDYAYVINENNTDKYPLMGPYGVDVTPPFVGTPSREPLVDIQPYQPVKISVNVTDRMSGVENVTLSFAIDGGKTWTSLPTSYNSSTSLYEATIPAQPSGTSVKYQIIAYDLAGNQALKDNDEGQYYVYIVVPEFILFLILPIFMVATLLAVIVYKRKNKISDVM